MDPFNALPNEMLEFIYKYLPPACKPNFARTCKRFNYVHRAFVPREEWFTTLFLHNTIDSEFFAAGTYSVGPPRRYMFYPNHRAVFTKKLKASKRKICTLFLGRHMFDYHNVLKYPLFKHMAKTVTQVYVDFFNLKLPLLYQMSSMFKRATFYVPKCEVGHSCMNLPDTYYGELDTSRPAFRVCTSQYPGCAHVWRMLVLTDSNPSLLQQKRKFEID